VHFPNSGICILRSGEDYLALCAGPNGQNGIGGHAHNHALSFSLYTGGIAWLIDPGTYTYTADYHTRDLFRSSAYHNTITIDDAEINPLDPHSPFSLPDLARSEIKLFEQGEDYDLLWAIHYGYNRFSSSVTHQRQVFFHKTTPVYWLIRDTLTGTGRHSFTLCLHPTQANIAIDPQGNIFLKTENQGLAVLFNTTIPMETILGDNWFSSGYGQRDKSNVIYRMSTSTLPVELRMIFRSFSVGQLTSEWLAETRDQAHKACSFLSKV
jgi:uncharacterized heparinase superfamily protein